MWDAWDWWRRVAVLALCLAAPGTWAQGAADGGTDADGGLSAADLQELQRALQEDLQAKGPSGAGAFSVGSSEAPGRPSAAGMNLVSLPGVASMNPDMAVIGDFALAAFSDRHPLQGGDHDPRQNGFNFQGLEMSLGAAVDPYFRADANLVFRLDGVEIEEAYVTTQALPYGLQVRAGQLLSRFGRFNSTHPHAWDFSDQPVVLSKMFGGEGNRGVGVETSWLAPLPWYLEVVGTVLDASVSPSFLGEQPRWVADPRMLLLVGAVKQFFPLTDSLSLSLGMSGATGPHASGRFDSFTLGNALDEGSTGLEVVRGLGVQDVGVPQFNGRDHRTEILGTDVYLRYRPAGRYLPSWRLPGSPAWVPSFDVAHQVLTVQAEWLVRRRQVSGGVLVDHGGFAQLFWRFSSRTALALRTEYASGVPASRLGGDPTDPDWTTWRLRNSASFNFWPTEFSRLRVQYNFDRPFYRDHPTHALFLTLEFAIGAHGAHAF